MNDIAWDEPWAQTPAAVEPGRSLIDLPNDPEELHCGSFELIQGKTRVSMDGIVTLHWLPTPEVRFRGIDAVGEGELDLEAAELHAGRAGLRGRALVLRHSPLAPGHRYEGVLQEGGLCGVRRAVREVRFQLLNFPHYLGDSVKYEREDGSTLSRSRIRFTCPNWVVTLDEVPECVEKQRRARARGGVVATHIGRIERPSGETFEFDEVSDLLNALHLFFGFLAGRWVGPVLATGWGFKRPAWKQFGNWRISTNPLARSWLPHQRGSEIAGLLAQFLELYARSLWHRPIQTLVNWYVHANAEARTTEAALTATAIPLELLAWLVVVEDGNHTSGTKFKDQSFAARISELLNRQGIPNQVPGDLRALSGSPLLAKQKSGPACFNAVRNALVHPRKAKRDLLATIDGHVLFELKELGLGYFELAFLAALGYRGHYARRIFEGWKGDELAQVPWA